MAPLLLRGYETKVWQLEQTDLSVLTSVCYSKEKTFKFQYEKPFFFTRTIYAGGVWWWKSLSPEAVRTIMHVCYIPDAYVRGLQFLSSDFSSSAPSAVFQLPFTYLAWPADRGGLNQLFLCSHVWSAISPVEVRLKKPTSCDLSPSSHRTEHADWKSIFLCWRARRRQWLH